jgi:hypothetical protein
MRQVLCGVLVLGVLATSSPAFAQGAPTHRMRNPKMAIVGLATMFVSGLMLIPNGDTYDILDSQYCVSPDARRVDYGACHANPELHARSVCPRRGRGHDGVRHQPRPH